MYEIPMELTELSQDVIWQHVNINMGSLTMMCWLVLPQMLQRRKGAIINISSSSSLGPLPYMNIYSASKVFDFYFSFTCEYWYSSFLFFVQDLRWLFFSSSIPRSAKLWSDGSDSGAVLHSHESDQIQRFHRTPFAAGSQCSNFRLECLIDRRCM